MVQKQKELLRKILTVLVLVTIMVVGMVSLKNYINRAEAIRAMPMVGKEALSYRKAYGSLPSGDYIDNFLGKIHAVRLPRIDYRAAWIEYGSNPDKTILAYAKKKYSGLPGSGYIVLWLNGKTEWLKAKDFEPILHSQQQPFEIDLLRENLRERSIP